MSDYSLHARLVSPESVIDTVIGLANSPRPLPVSDLSKVIDKNERYTRAAIHICEELGFARKVGSEYVIDSSIEEEARKISPDQGSVLMNRHLLRYEPFMTFVSFLAKGYDSEKSAQTVETLYEMDTDPDIVRKEFVDIGQYANILTSDGEPKPTVEVETLPTSYIENLQDALRSEAKTRLFVHERLGEDVVSYADAESIEKIQDSLFTFRESPDTAIVESVVGAENITRELADDEGDPETDYSNANGIGQVAQRMSGDDLVLKRHLHGANYLGNMRVPGSHGKEKETLESWEVDEEVALEVILATMDYVRSLYWFVKYERQIL